MAKSGMLSERDALHQGDGQDTCMNVVETGCNREEVSRMWAWTCGTGTEWVQLASSTTNQAQPEPAKRRRPSPRRSQH